MRLAERYVESAGPVVTVLRRLLETRGDRRGRDAVEAIDLLCPSLLADIRSALASSSIDPVASPSDDAAARITVARLTIGDSRRAWKVLMEPGRATADGVPARMVAMLDELDEALAARFPWLGEQLPLVH